MAAALAHSLMLLLLLSAFSDGHAEPKVPAIFVFGDSSADVGNNNYLPHGYKANFFPYGIDYPSHIATGRFSNGYNGADILAQLLGFDESPPPFLSLVDNTNDEINITGAMKGINFASGGSTLLDWDPTGINGEITISMTNQRKNFANFWSQLNETLPNEQIDELFSKSLFLTSIGGNDIGAYLHDSISIRNLSNIELLLDFVFNFVPRFTKEYEKHVKELYALGGRKFGIVDIAPAGCVPKVKINFNHSGICADDVNGFPSELNNLTKIKMNDLSSTLTGMKYSIASSYAVFMKIINNPGAFGFIDVDHPCCGSAEIDCTENATFCSNRDQYLFWDNVHPTQATANVFGRLVYTGSTKYASPINFKELLEDGNNLISVY